MFVFSEMYENIKVSYTNVKYDIKHLTYTMETIKSMIENIKDIIENGTHNNKETIISNILTNNDNIPIIDQQTLDNIEKMLESPTVRHQIVCTLLLKYNIFKQIKLF